MEKSIKDRFLVENKLDKTFVDVEIIERNSNSDPYISPTDDDMEMELELEDIDLIQARDSAAVFDSPSVRANPVHQWQEETGHALVLYPKPRTTRRVEELATVISSLPTISEYSDRQNPTYRLLSYVAVAAISILATWFFLGGPLRTASPTREPADKRELLAASVTISDNTPDDSLLSRNTSPDVPTAPSRDADHTRDASHETRLVDDQASPSERSREAAPSPILPPPSPIAPVAKPTAPRTPRVSKTTAPPKRSKEVSTAARASGRAAVRPVKPPLAPSSEPVPANGPIPETLSKAAVRHIMEGLASEVHKCRNAISGRVVVEVVVSGVTGRVIFAKPIDQVTVGAKAGRCAARAVESAVFPPFGKPTLTIKFPYDI